MEGRRVKEANLLWSVGMAVKGWVSERVERRRKSVSEVLTVGDDGKRLNRGCWRGSYLLVFLTVYESSGEYCRGAP